MGLGYEGRDLGLERQGTNGLSKRTSRKSSLHDLGSRFLLRRREIGIVLRRRWLEAEQLRAEEREVTSSEALEGGMRIWRDEEREELGEEWLLMVK